MQDASRVRRGAEKVKTRSDKGKKRGPQAKKVGSHIGEPEAKRARGRPSDVFGRTTPRFTSIRAPPPTPSVA